MRYLGHINATGSCLAAYAAALENTMYFAKPSPFQVFYDATLTSPVMRITLEPLETLDRASRLILLLEGLLQQSKVKAELDAKHVHHVYFILPTVDIEPIIDDAILRQLLTEHGHSELAFSQHQQLLEHEITKGALILSADSQVNAQDLYHTDVTALQLVDSPLGYTPSEGACAFYNALQSSLAATRFDGNLAQQLQQAEATPHDTIVFAGQPSERWNYQWYAASQRLYGKDDPLIELLTTDTVSGYLGVCQYWMTKVLAHALLTNPVTAERRRVLVIDTQPTPHIIVYARSEG